MGAGAVPIIGLRAVPLKVVQFVEPRNSCRLHRYNTYIDDRAAASHRYIHTDQIACVVKLACFLLVQWMPRNHRARRDSPVASRARRTRGANLPSRASGLAIGPPRAAFAPRVRRRIGGIKKRMGFVAGSFGIAGRRIGILIIKSNELKDNEIPYNKNRRN